MDGRLGPWGGIFLASGLFAMVASLMAVGSASWALPYAVVLWLVTVYAGYRIWKAAHPAASFWRDLSRRTVAVITFAATVVASLFILAAPQLILVIVGFYLGLGALFYLVGRSLR